MPKRRSVKATPSPAPEPHKPPEAADSNAPPEDERAAEKGKTNLDDTPPYDPRELPLDEIARCLRIQMADKEWRSRDQLDALTLTIDEDPAGAELLSLAFGYTKTDRAKKLTKRAWLGAQAAMSASPIGRTLGAQVRLAPGGGRWHVQTYIPAIGTGPFEKKGFRTPLAALSAVERHYRLQVIEAGVRTVIARERWAAQHQADAAGTPEPAPSEALSGEPHSDEGG